MLCNLFCHKGRKDPIWTKYIKVTKKSCYLGGMPLVSFLDELGLFRNLPEHEKYINSQCWGGTFG